ncbi:hypothetical protein Zmor_002617 [Zophobas morio]|uniref:Uncharacterized protein n=1 Tax=Zophobas morio TaxID=2755281 RepID=A0AA38J1C5_9CUCU|nr:hypothetical protein Zmor_002617 [Zophobas morio]
MQISDPSRDFGSNSVLNSVAVAASHGWGESISYLILCGVELPLFTHAQRVAAGTAFPLSLHGQRCNGAEGSIGKKGGIHQNCCVTRRFGGPKAMRKALKSGTRS